MRFLARRIAFYLVTAWAALSVNFLLPHLMPGNPVEAELAKLQGSGSAGAAKALEAQFGLDTHSSLLSQYGHYWSQLFHGNLGISIANYPEHVSSIIASELPWTLGLVGIASVLSFVLGTLLGIVIAWRRGGKLDSLLPVGTFLSAVPTFWVGLILITFVGLKLHWLPFTGASNGMVGLDWSFIGSVISHGVLPALTIVLASIAGWMVGMRNMMVTTMSEDYVMVAQAKGLPNRRVMFAYAARNAILPNLAGFALQLGFVVAGSVATEYIFNYPGIGSELVSAVTGSDYPLIQGLFLVITLVVLLANFAADLLYVLLDPRTRQEA